MADISGDGAKIPIEFTTTGADKAAEDVAKVRDQVEGATDKGAEAVVKAEEKKQEAIGKTQEEKEAEAELYRKDLEHAEKEWAVHAKAYEEQKKRDTESKARRRAKQEEEKAAQAASDKAFLESLAKRREEEEAAFAIREQEEEEERQRQAEARVAEARQAEEKEAALQHEQKILGDIAEDQERAAAKELEHGKKAEAAMASRVAGYTAAAGAIATVSKFVLSSLEDVIARADEIDPEFGEKLKDEYSLLLDLAHPIDAFAKAAKQALVGDVMAELDSLETSIANAKEAHDKWVEAYTALDHAGLDSMKQRKEIQDSIDAQNLVIIQQFYAQRDAQRELAGAYRETAKAAIDANPQLSDDQKKTARAALDKQASDDRRQAAVDEQMQKKQLAEKNLKQQQEANAREKVEIENLWKAYEDFMNKRSEKEKEFQAERLRNPKQESMISDTTKNVINVGAALSFPGAGTHLQNALSYEATPKLTDSQQDELKQLKIQADAKKNLAREMEKKSEGTMQSAANEVSNTNVEVDRQLDVIAKSSAAEDLTKALETFKDKQKELVGWVSQVGDNLKAVAQRDDKMPLATKEALDKLTKDIAQAQNLGMDDSAARLEKAKENLLKKEEERKAANQAGLANASATIEAAMKDGYIDWTEFNQILASLQAGQVKSAGLYNAALVSARETIEANKYVTEQNQKKIEETTMKLKNLQADLEMMRQQNDQSR